MIRSETLYLGTAFVAVASGIHGFAVHRKRGVTGPYLARVRYAGDGADRDVIVQEGLWYSLVRRVERLQLSTLGGTADIYLTTADHPDDLVTQSGVVRPPARSQIIGTTDLFAIANPAGDLALQPSPEASGVLCRWYVPVGGSVAASIDVMPGEGEDETWWRVWGETLTAGSYFTYVGKGGMSVGTGGWTVKGSINMPLPAYLRLNWTAVTAGVLFRAINVSSLD